VRLDRYLFCIRLAKSRTLAQAILAEGRTRIDGRRVEKLSEPVGVGSIVTIALRGEIRVFEVLALPDRRGPPAEARAAYRLLGVDDSGRAA